MPSSTRSLRHTALAALLITAGLLVAHQDAEDEKDPLARARAHVERGENEAAAAALRTALEQADPSAPPPAEWTTELERIDSVYQSTKDARRTGAVALLEIAAADRDAGWERMANIMEGFAFELDPATARATLGSSGGSVSNATASDDLQYYFGEPDIAPLNSSWELVNGALRLKPNSIQLVQCVGERTPTRFVLTAELHHDGTQASFGIDFELRSRSSFLRAELNLRQGQIEPRLSSFGELKSSSTKVGSKTPWSPDSTTWIPIELRVDGENIALRVGTDASVVELRVPPRLGAGRLALFVQNGGAQKLTCLRGLKVKALEGGR